ncbi:hypothetical protein ACHAWO_001105 [Cyclotella atomus]|uniref:Uncharacterized protein n=1 Tax=Cyclotella atomus TaxID=382360 RepID=A0ABD3PKU8_9STRA
MVLPLRQWIQRAKGNETNVSQILLPPPGVDLADKITVELQSHPTHSGGGGVHNNIENLNDDNLLAQLDAIGQDDGVDFSQMNEDELLEALDALGMTEQHDLGEENTNTYLNMQLSTRQV